MELTLNNPYITNIMDFIDDERVKQKIIKATLKNNSSVTHSIIINVVAPAIRSTEKTEGYNHLFFKTKDGLFLNLKNDDFEIEITDSNLISSDGYNLSSLNNFLLECLEEEG